MNNRDIWFGILPNLGIRDIFELRCTCKALYKRFTSNGFWADLITHHCKNLNRGVFLKLEMGKIDPVVKFCKILVELGIMAIPGIEKWENLEVVAKVAGETGNKDIIKYYKLLGADKSLSYGIARSGRYSLLKKFDLGVDKRPSNFFAILSGMASFGKLKSIQVLFQKYGNIPEAEINEKSPVEPLFKSLHYPKTFKYLFEKYANTIRGLEAIFNSGFSEKAFETCDYLITLYGNTLITENVYLLVKDVDHVKYIRDKLPTTICLFNLILYDKLDKETFLKLTGNSSSWKDDLLGIALDRDNPKVIKFLLEGEYFRLKDIPIRGFGNCLKYLARLKHPNMLEELDVVFRATNIDTVLEIIRNYAKTSRELKPIMEKYPNIHILKAVYERLKSEEW